MQMQVFTLTFKYPLLKRKIEVQFFFLSKIQINPNQIISNYFFHSYSKQTYIFDAIWKEKWHLFKRKDVTTFSHKTFNSLTKRKTNLEIFFWFICYYEKKKHKKKHTMNTWNFIPLIKHPSYTKKLWFFSIFWNKKHIRNILQFMKKSKERKFFFYV